MQSNFNDFLILDYYVDEPACLGVPPFFATYPRYIAGALRAAGIPEQSIIYQSIDHLRKTQHSETQSGFDLTQNIVGQRSFAAIFIVGGYTVPGKYLTTSIGTIQELIQFLESYRKQIHKNTPIFIGGPFQYMPFSYQQILRQHQAALLQGDIEKTAYLFASSHAPGFSAPRAIYDPTRELQKRTTAEIHTWARLGAFITRQSWYHPTLIMEMETYRGCTRNAYCSFCTEPLYGKPQFRSPDSIAQEMNELLLHGNAYFRLGRQADLLTYQAAQQSYTNSFTEPNPRALETLYNQINQLRGIRLLHLDNINPGTIYHYPNQSARTLEIIAQHHSPGDTAALGIESFDPKVIQANQLKVNTAEAMKVIQIVNHAGGHRNNGIPQLLPGINLLHGLPGETKQTFAINFDALQKILDQGLLLRRINIRQVSIFTGTLLDKNRHSTGKASHSTKKQSNNFQQSLLHEKFLYYKEKIRSQIDKPMLRMLFPPGTRIINCLVEKQEHNISWIRPLWSYPITIKVFEVLRPRTMVDCVVTGYDERSLQGITQPICINSLSANALQHLPGIGKKKAQQWLLLRPFSDTTAFLDQISPGKEFLPFIPHLSTGSCVTFDPGHD